MRFQSLLRAIERHQMLDSASECATAALPRARTGIFWRLLRPHVELGTEGARSQTTASASGLRADDVIVDGWHNGGADAGHDAAGRPKNGGGRVRLRGGVT